MKIIFDYTVHSYNILWYWNLNTNKKFVHISSSETSQLVKNSVLTKINQTLRS